MVPMQSVLFSARDEEGFRVARLRQKQIIGLGGGEVSSELGSGAFLLVVFATHCLWLGWQPARLRAPRGRSFVLPCLNVHVLTVCLRHSVDNFLDAVLHGGV